jgi:hypothetical protein
MRLNMAELPATTRHKVFLMAATDTRVMASEEGTKITEQYMQGFLNDDEFENQLINLWSKLCRMEQRIK